MTLKRLTPMIWTDQFEETLHFYTEILGFNCSERNDTWGWASLSSGDVDLMIAKPNEHTPFDGCKYTGSFYFYVDDVEFWYLKLKEKAKLAYDLEEFEWQMKEFAVYDNNGYMLQFGQDMSPA